MDPAAPLLFPEVDPRVYAKVVGIFDNEEVEGS